VCELGLGSCTDVLERSSAIWLMDTAGDLRCSVPAPLLLLTLYAFTGTMSCEEKLLFVVVVKGKACMQRPGSSTMAGCCWVASEGLVGAV